MILTVHPASFHSYILFTHWKRWAMTMDWKLHLQGSCFSLKQIFMVTILFVVRYWHLRSSEYNVPGVSIPVNVTTLSQWPKLYLLTWSHHNPHFCFLYVGIYMMCDRDPVMGLEKSAKLEDVERTGQWPWSGRCQHRRRAELVILINPATGSNHQLQTSWISYLPRVLWRNRCGCKEYEPGSLKDEPKIPVHHFTGDVIWLLSFSELVSLMQRGKNCGTPLDAWHHFCRGGIIVMPHWMFGIIYAEGE